ncbi:two-component sensor histidine kinase [Paenibacillus odorifer]|uniref:histidine kinase n=1 Tax=Paenibacillus odorifer TaxID=189426 RepID=A0A1R0Z8C4_9BACL|nr:HAMP domain-containing sensor histidine kinase [Paenibacillus odorifer]OMD55588.1 two-component sensor histidine kinase [Paenibacillus odorifer]OME64363.1 two-component sensor histidine kinase [Paenibacillus odorifer]
MNSKYITTIRWKFIYAFLLSVLSGGLLLFAGYQLVNFMIYLNPVSESAPYSRILRWIINHIGSMPLLTAAGIISFLLFFFIYTRKIVLYLEEITKGIREITSSGMSHRIEVRTTDELGVLAENINEMAERLQHSVEEERKAVNAKNDLITGVSHDLRTPLTSVLGFLEYIEQDRCQEEVEIRYYVSIAYNKSLVLRKLIDDLFEYTRVNSGEYPLVMERLDLKAFIRQLAEESVPELTKAEMTYEIDDQAGELWIEASPKELVRAYENLITNAIRYGRSGGKVEIGFSKRGNEAVVRISNFGEMIAESDIPFIFERFYRAEKSRSQHTGGSGLGLAISKSIVERHNGVIYVESSPLRTDFITYFPFFIES